jgi:hypothetical protein
VRNLRDAFRVHACLILALLALSLVLWWRVWITGDPASTITCQCGDPSLFLWFTAWVPWSISHLHSPLLSNAIYAGQGGADTLDTAVLLPPLVVSPITALFGPVAGFNVLVLLAPVVDGWSMFLFLRKVTGFLPGQLIAATFYGFSPYVVTNLPFGHFNVDLVFFPPLALWCLYDLLVARAHEPWRVGAALGALVIIQFFAGPELLAMCAVLGVFCAIGLLVVAPRLVLARLRPLVQACALAATIATVGLAYPVWFLVAGPRHTVGYPWPGTPGAGNAVSAVVRPGSYRAPSLFDQIGGYFGPRGPTEAYLGIALIGLVAVAVVLWRRRRLAWCLAGLAAVGWALSLGAGSESSSLWLPWRIFDHIPVVSEILPERFSLFTDFGLAALLSLSLDLCWQRRERVLALFLGRRNGLRDKIAPRRADIAYAAGCCGVAIAALVPVALTYDVAFVIHDQPPPAWFLSVAPRLSPGTVLLTMPYPSSAESQAMAWQADVGFAFAMVGGYALVPGGDGRQSIYVDPPAGAAAILDTLSFGIAPEPSGSLTETSEVRRALRAWGVQVVVVAPQARDAAYAVGFLTATLGREPLWQAGTWVWYGLGPDPPLGLGPARLFLCSSRPQKTPLATPSCVLARA